MQKEGERPTQIHWQKRERGEEYLRIILIYLFQKLQRTNMQNKMEQTDGNKRSLKLLKWMKKKTCIEFCNFQCPLVFTGMITRNPKDYTKSTDTVSFYWFRGVADPEIYKYAEINTTRRSKRCIGISSTIEL